MACTIRPYQPHDADALRLVYQQARQLAFPWVDPLRFQLLDFDEVIQGETVLVALQHRVPIGFIAWWPPDNFIHSLFVRPQLSQKGVGKALVHACLQQLGRPATLKCYLANQRALQFYASLGWRSIDEAQGPYGPYVILTFDE